MHIIIYASRAERVNSDMSFFPSETARDNKGIIMVIRTVKVGNSFISFLRVN